MSSRPNRLQYCREVQGPGDIVRKDLILHIDLGQCQLTKTLGQACGGVSMYVSPCCAIRYGAAGRPSAVPSRRNGRPRRRLWKALSGSLLCYDRRRFAMMCHPSKIGQEGSTAPGLASPVARKNVPISNERLSMPIAPIGRMTRRGFMKG